jgi:hypothetical protein
MKIVTTVVVLSFLFIGRTFAQNKNQIQEK